MTDIDPLQLALACGQTGAAIIAVVSLSWAMRRPWERLSRRQERELASLKCARLVVYCSLTVIQACLAASRAAVLLTVGNTTPLTMAMCLVQDFSLALAWGVHAVWLYVGWSYQGAARLLPSSLLSLVAGAVALAADGASQDGDTEGDRVEQMRVASIVVHGAMLVLLLGLLVVELVMSGHVEAALAVRGAAVRSAALRTGAFTRSSMAAGAAGTGSGLTEPLLGGVTGAFEDQEEAEAAAEEEALEKAARKADKTRGKAPKASRRTMATAAFRYVLPDSAGLRARLTGCFVLVASERAVNLAVPLLYKRMVDTLSSVTALHTAASLTDSPPTLIHALLKAAVEHNSTGAVVPTGASMADANATDDTWSVRRLLEVVVPFWHVFLPWVAAYLGFWYLRGGSGMEGLLSSCRDILWAPITQAAYRRVNRDVFGHLLELDHSFHVKRKTGQIMRILDRGTSAIQDTVSIVLFNVIPQMADIGVACAYLAVAMEPWAAVIVAVTVASYVPLTVIITERRGEVRKRMNALDNAREARATDMLLNWETVKLFCAESLELEGYDTATRQYQAQEYWQLAFLSLLAIAQGTCVWGGLVAGCVVCVKGVAGGTLTVGDAVLFITLMNQLYVPLTFFGSYYRQVQKALVDVENMFELLATQPRVQNEPGAKPLRIIEGALALDRVVFGYKPTPSRDSLARTSAPTAAQANGQPRAAATADVLPAAAAGLGPTAGLVLRGISFSIRGGTTLAVVGSSGSGKSTLLRLLLRFYDPWSGAVLVDGQDIKHATLASVRRAISVVPQDSVLFNQSIAYNIRYGAPEASDAEVEAAAEVAAVHNTIMAFKKGYKTRVGERGLRLSGGEKQRVAFARAVVKKPAILVLDEATSALDSITEASIQRSLAALRSSVTTVIVAHRLSTIKDADTILVLSEGQVAQCGSHAELMEAGGLYAAMWSRQKTALADDIVIPDGATSGNPNPIVSNGHAETAVGSHGSVSGGLTWGDGTGAPNGGNGNDSASATFAREGSGSTSQPHQPAGSNPYVAGADCDSGIPVPLYVPAIPSREWEFQPGFISPILGLQQPHTHDSTRQHTSGSAVPTTIPGASSGTNPSPPGTGGVASSAISAPQPAPMASPVAGLLGQGSPESRSPFDAGPFTTSELGSRDNLSFSSGLSATTTGTTTTSGMAQQEPVSAAGSRGPSTLGGGTGRFVPQRLQQQASTEGRSGMAQHPPASAAGGGPLSPSERGGGGAGPPSPGWRAGGGVRRGGEAGGLREPLLRQQATGSHVVVEVNRQQELDSLGQRTPHPTVEVPLLQQFTMSGDSTLLATTSHGGAATPTCEWSRHPTPARSRAAHDHDEDAAHWADMQDEQRDEEEEEEGHEEENGDTEQDRAGRGSIGEDAA